MVSGVEGDGLWNLVRSFSGTSSFNIAFNSIFLSCKNCSVRFSVGTAGFTKRGEHSKRQLLRLEIEISESV